MSISVVALLIFLALAAALGAIAFCIRDLFFSPRRPDQSPGRPVRLRRIPPLSDEQSSPSLVGAFDRWFLHLVRETGLAWSPVEATLLLILVGVTLGSAMFVWSEHPLLATLGMFAGTAATLVYLIVRRGRRIRLLQDQLPSALDMLARSMRAGQSLDESVDLVGHRSPEPLAGEFRYCASQLALGLSMPAVMRSLVTRVRFFDVRIFTTTLTVHRQTGGNLANVMERLAAVIRERLTCRRQLRSVTGAGRFSAMLIGLIGPLLFVYMFFFHPDYARAMLESPLGQSMLIAAVVLETIGLIWTARLLKPIY